MKAAAIIKAVNAAMAAVGATPYLTDEEIAAWIGMVIRGEHQNIDTGHASVRSGELAAEHRIGVALCLAITEALAKVPDIAQPEIIEAPEESEAEPVAADPAQPE